MLEKIQNFFGNIKNPLPGIVEDVRNTINDNVIAPVVSGAQNIYNAGVDAFHDGRNYLAGVGLGIQDNIINPVIETVSNIPSQIYDFGNQNIFDPIDRDLNNFFETNLGTNSQFASNIDKFTSGLSTGAGAKIVEGIQKFGARGNEKIDDIAPALNKFARTTDGFTPILSAGLKLLPGGMLASKAIDFGQPSKISSDNDSAVASSYLGSNSLDEGYKKYLEQSKDIIKPFNLIFSEGTTEQLSREQYNEYVTKYASAFEKEKESQDKSIEKQNKINADIYRDLGFNSDAYKLDLQKRQQSLYSGISGSDPYVQQKSQKIGMIFNELDSEAKVNSDIVVNIGKQYSDSTKTWGGSQGLVTKEDFERAKQIAKIATERSADIAELGIKKNGVTKEDIIGLIKNKGLDKQGVRSISGKDYDWESETIEGLINAYITDDLSNYTESPTQLIQDINTKANFLRSWEEYSDADSMFSVAGFNYALGAGAYLTKPVVNFIDDITDGILVRLVNEGVGTRDKRSESAGRIAGTTASKGLAFYSAIDDKKGVKTARLSAWVDLNKNIGNMVGLVTTTLAGGLLGSSGKASALTSVDDVAGALGNSYLVSNLSTNAGRFGMPGLSQSFAQGGTNYNFTLKAYQALQYSNKVGAKLIKPVATEIFQESVALGLDPEIGSKFSQDLSMIGVVAGALIETALPIAGGVKSVINGSISRDFANLRLADDLVREVSGGSNNIKQDLIGLVNGLTDSAMSKVSAGGKSAEAKIAIKAAIADQVISRDVVEKAVRAGVISQTLAANAGLIGVKSSGVENTDIGALNEAINQFATKYDITDQDIKLWQQIRSMSTDDKIQIPDMIKMTYDVKDGKIVIPEGGLKGQVVTSRGFLDRVNVTPSVEVTPRAYEALNTVKKRISFDTIYTKKDIEEIANTAKQKGLSLGSTTDPTGKQIENGYYGFTKTQGGYVLDLKQAGPSIGVNKLQYSVSDVAKMSDTEEDFVGVMKQINEQSGAPIYNNVDTLASSGSIGKSLDILAKIVCP